MEDVVLHYQPGSRDGLSSLLERTEKLLEPFPCRPPPVFTPWFPTAGSGCRLPIRPARPAPVIAGSGGLLTAAKAQAEDESRDTIGCPVAGKRSVYAETPPTTPQRPKDAVCISETPNHLLREAELPGKQPQPIRRSWSVFTQKGVLLQSSGTLSTHFHHMLSIHRLHLRQRAKWVISKCNCSDIEKVGLLSEKLRPTQLLKAK